MDRSHAENFEIVDSHFHIWDLKRFFYPWPSQDDETLFKDYTIQQYIEASKCVSTKHAVFVQVLNRNTDEIDWVFDLAKRFPIIKGVVGGIDLTASNLADVLDKYSKNELFVGVRHILDFEKTDWIASEEVLQGLTMLQAHGLTFDLLIRTHHLCYLPSVVGAFPRLKFVVDHIAKPLIKEKKIDQWKDGMAEIAKYPNVFCKISGLVTEADLSNWQTKDFLPYIKVEDAVKMARHLRVLTFDITNTIIAVKKSPGFWYAEAAQEVGIVSEVAKLDQVAGPVRKQLTAEYPHYGYHLGLNPKDWWTELIMRTFKAAGYNNDPLKFQLLGEIVYVMFEGKKCYDVLPGSHSMLETVKKNGFSIGIISNFDERLPKILEDHKLDGFFDFMVSSATVLYEKPDPRIFHDALRKVNVSAEETAHIGDDIVKDYWGAKNAGFNAFLYDPHRKLKDHELDQVDRGAIYHDHCELPKLLDCC